MKFKRKWYAGTYTLGEAIETQLSDNGRDGQLEKLESELDKTKEMLNKLICMLHLDQEFVLQLLPEFEVIND